VREEERATHLQFLSPAFYFEVHLEHRDYIF